MQSLTSDPQARMPTPRRHATGVATIRPRRWLFVLALVGTLAPPALPPAAAQPPGVIEPFDNSLELYRRAARYYKHGSEVQNAHDRRLALQMAIPLYRQFLHLRPDGELAQQAAYELGMSLLLTGELQDAEHTFRTIITRHQRGKWVALSAYRIAAQMYNRQEWLLAAPFFATATRQATEADLRHKALFYEARCLTYAKQTVAAIDRLETIVNDPANPFREYARLAIGQLYAADGRHEKALENFELLLGPGTSPQERAQALLAAGVSASKLGQSARAESLLNQTLDAAGLDPQFRAQAQLALMEMRFEEENYSEAVKIFRRGEFLGENDVMAKLYMVAGKSLAKLDRNNEAIRQFFNAERYATSVRPKPMIDLAFEASYRRLSSFYQINGPNIPGQVDAFVEIYADRFPSSPWLQKARLMKAEILFHQGAIARAAAAYNDINASALPEDLRADVYFKRGWCLGDTGEYGRAAQNLSSFIVNYPDHPSIHEALAKRAQAYVELGDRGSALKDFKRLMDDGVDPVLAAYAYQQSARIAREEHNYADMIASYTKLLETQSALDSRSRADANYWIGWGYYKQEEWAKCIPYLETARTLLPTRFKEPAGVHIVLAAYSLLDSDKLKEAAERLMVDAPAQRLPVRMMIWLGLERFSKSDYQGADRFLSLASTPDEPDLTDVIVWRHLVKAQIELRHFERALKTLEILLARKQEDFWMADAYLDKSHALIGKERWEEAREAAHEGLQLDPQGTVRAGLYMSLADIAMNRKDYESAAASYLRTSEMFIDDKEIKPLALHRAAEAFEKNGQTARAAEIREQLRNEFPSWTAAKS